MDTKRAEAAAALPREPRARRCHQRVEALVAASSSDCFAVTTRARPGGRFGTGPMRVRVDTRSDHLHLAAESPLLNAQQLLDGVLAVLNDDRHETSQALIAVLEEELVKHLRAASPD